MNNIFKCTYPGCGHTETSDQQPRHQHGIALVEMRRAIDVKNARGDDLAGKGKSKHFNSYSD